MSGRRNLMIANAAASGAPSVPLTLTAQSANSTVTLSKTGSPTVSGLRYRMGTSGDWLPYAVGTTLTLAAVGDAVQFRNTESTLSINGSHYVRFSLTGQIAASGSVMSMLNDSDTPAEMCFIFLFQYCAALTRAPELPAMTLAPHCYNRMFAECTGLAQAPALPATALANYCCYGMFSGCAALTQAPELPATTLADFCYASMFGRCTNLTQAPALPATTLARSCYNSMFYNCTALTQAPVLPATMLVADSNCYNSMFSTCTNLTRIEVAFTEWKSSATATWVKNVPGSGTFVKPAALPTEYADNRIPTGWTVVNK